MAPSAQLSFPAPALRSSADGPSHPVPWFLPRPRTDPRAVPPAVCDRCVVLLLDDLEQAAALLPAVRELLQGVSASSMAWAQLHRLNASIADLQVGLGPAPQRPLPACGASTSLLPRASSGAPQVPAMRQNGSWTPWNNRA